MTIRLAGLALAAALLLGGSPGRAYLARHPIEMALEVVVNPVEGSPRSACEAAQEIEAFVRKRWRIAVAGTDVDCGDEPAALAAPLLEADVSVAARLLRASEDEKILAVQLTVSTVEGSTSREAKRELFFADDGDVFVPLLVAGPDAQQTSGIREVLLRVSSRMQPDPRDAPYGRASVTVGAEPGELFLDGGRVTDTSGAGETSVLLVPVGLRELSVRDASGDERTKVVRVMPGRTVLVDLRPGEVHPYRLAPLGKNGAGHEEYRREADGAVVVRIPEGEFLMGNEETERTPMEHRVYVSEFLIDRTGVTWGQFETFAEATGTPLPLHEPYWGIHDDHPMVYVTWEEARAYCEWAGARLPTEAEREKAARGTDERTYPWGEEEPDPERAVFRLTWGYHGTAAVGTHPAGASPYGVQDLGGNVWEWCADWYDGDYYEVGPKRDPKGPAVGRAHVVRGGSWDSRPTVLTASTRSWGHRGYRDGDFGFRCAMDPPR